jgi:WD40 repeat protein
VPPVDPKALLKMYQPKLVRTLKPDQQLCAIRFSPDGKTLAAGSFEARIRRWNFADDAYPELPAMTGHNGWIQDIAFAPDSSRLFSADSWGRLIGWTNPADTEPKPAWNVEKAHDGWIHQIALNPAGTILASAGRDRTIRLTSPADGKAIRTLEPGEDSLSVAFHPSGKHLLTGDLKGIVRQWNPETGKVEREFDAKLMFLRDRIQDVGGVRCFAFDAKGETLFVGGSQPKSGGFVQGMSLILVFDWATGKLKHTLKTASDNEGYVYQMAIHPDGFILAVSSGQPGTGKFFFQRPEDPAPFYIKSDATNCHSFAVHPNGTRIVVSGTNANSAGNGRQLGKDKEYPGNYSPLHVLDLPKPM